MATIWILMVSADDGNAIGLCDISGSFRIEDIFGVSVYGQNVRRLGIGQDGIHSIENENIYT